LDFRIHQDEQFEQEESGKWPDARRMADHAGCCARASVAMLARVAAVISGERPCSSLIDRVMMDRVIADIEENDFRPLIADKLKKNAVAGVNKEAALILKLAVKGMHF
jgi:hypothetical protein